MDESITPGIRQLVAWLNSKGFETTDSGDGVTNVEAGMECAMATPNVAIAVSPDVLVSETRRLFSLLVSELKVAVSRINEDASTVMIQATFDPGDESAVIMLTGLDDHKAFHSPN